MITPQIEILISPTGESKITTRGIVGPRCREASRSYEAVLGTRTDETLTTEYYQTSLEENYVAERYDRPG